MAIRMELKRILVMENEHLHPVELREVGGERIFSIMVGLSEAAAIERRLLGQVPSRPQTLELLASVIDALGATLEKVLISDLKYIEDLQGKCYCARLFLRQGDKLLEIDSRSSDAIALGAATNVPIYVDEQVLEEALRD
jgi:bifunctional DNase/RNase